MPFDSDTILRGKDGNVKLSTISSGATGAVGLTAWNCGINIPMEKIRIFGVDGKVVIPGDVEWSGSFSGVWVTGATGASGILQTLLANENITITLEGVAAGTTKLAGSARLSGVDVSWDANQTAATISANFEGEGVPTLTAT